MSDKSECPVIDAYLLSIEDNTIISLLDKGFNLKLKDCPLRHGDILIAPQVKEGKSIWAKYLAKNIILPYSVIWAFKDTQPKEWLAVRIELPFGFVFSKNKEKKIRKEKKSVCYFNLRSPKDRYYLKLLETEFKVFVEKTKLGD